MNDPGRPPQTDAFDADSEETAQIVIKDRPEVAACLNGLVFRGQEDAMIPLLRAALLNMTASVLLDIEDEDGLSACIADLTIQAERLPLAVKALEWEIQTQLDPQAMAPHRSAGYRVEIDELLHGPLPPLELVDSKERDAVIRRVNGSLEREAERGDADAEARTGELQAILEDVGPGPADMPCFLASLGRPRLAEWLARWSDDAFREGQEQRGVTPAAADPRFDHLLGEDLPVLRGIQNRLRPRGKIKRGIAAQDCPPIIPRSAS
jgi:hypothetical protein